MIVYCIELYRYTLCISLLILLTVTQIQFIYANLLLCIHTNDRRADLPKMKEKMMLCPQPSKVSLTATDVKILLFHKTKSNPIVFSLTSSLCINQKSCFFLAEPRSAECMRWNVSSGTLEMENQLLAFMHLEYKKGWSGGTVFS